ncbi:HAD superfamily protein, putative [Plasmodium ovale curtisi]|uniref:phosphatidate phosphatase n=1 Tax=Plasmodium ovale curtisi TaxID=864141 RepID=A0A1A8WDN5_PLAOA|nr:HAD superfamily protein, putative [Plasmodium ovale curtisi]SBS90133.1 HAD superfamily protein, putative [Plasmodium ovale curtisi]
MYTHGPLSRDIHFCVKWDKIVSSVSNALDFNHATLSGCIDIVCIESEIETSLKNDGKVNVIYKSTPFHVRFGKTKLLRSKEKVVSILVNGKSTNLHMKLGSAGEAYFVEKTYDDVEEDLETSPLSSPRHYYDDLYLDQHIDSCSINDSFNNFKSDEEEDDDENGDDGGEDHNERDDLFASNLISTGRRNVDKSHRREESRGRRRSNRERRSKSDSERKGKEGREKKKKKKKKGSFIHHAGELLDIPEVTHRRSSRHSMRRRKEEEDEHNANSEWSWSWGRLPHLKTHDYISDNCTVVSSNNKKKGKVKRNCKTSQSVQDQSSSVENRTSAKKRNLSESNLRKSANRKGYEKKFEGSNQGKVKGERKTRDTKKDKLENSHRNAQANARTNEQGNVQKNEKGNAHKNSQGSVPGNVQKKRVKDTKDESKGEQAGTDPSKFMGDNVQDGGETGRGSRLEGSATEGSSQKGARVDGGKSNQNMKKGTQDGDQKDNIKGSFTEGRSHQLTNPRTDPRIDPRTNPRVGHPSDRLSDRQMHDKAEANAGIVAGSFRVAGESSEEYADGEMESNDENNHLECTKEDEQENTFDDDIQNRIECSLCGHLLLNQNAENDQCDYSIEIHNKNIFEANIVTYDQIDKNSNLWYHPSLVFRFDKKDPYYPSRVALPLLASWVVFNQPLSIMAVEKLLNSSLTLVEVKDKGWRNWFGVSSAEYDNNVNIKNVKKDCKGGNINTEKIEKRKEESKREDSRKDNWSKLDDTPSMRDSQTKRTEISLLNNHSELSKSSVMQREERIKVRYRKSLRPTSEQLQSLNLKEGANTITFLVTSSLQGTKSITGTIYLWKKNAKIVISDVDGTITRSNVLGHIMPIVGKDWSHVGVSQLFNKINNNGYHILYLTARAIGQADSTREYLFRFKRNANNKLPDGPLILSPDRLFPSFKREVIDKKPYIFKISALRDIRNLFPLNHNPFYAAFGNTESDHRAYISVGVPEAKVFIIDNRGIVHHVNSTYAKTYETMSEITEHMFPCIKSDKKREDDDQVKIKISP